MILYVFIFTVQLLDKLYDVIKIIVNDYSRLNLLSIPIYYII